MATFPTVDHRSGTAYRDTEFQVASTGTGTVVSGQGGIRYNGSAFQMLDAKGQYDPRTAAKNAAVTAHTTVYDLPHVLAGSGPVLQGAYKTQTFYNGAFLNTETWWTSTAQKVKLSEHSFTYTTSNYINPSTESWTLYDGTTANAVVHRIVDTISYSGIVETGRTRSYS